MNKEYMRAFENAERRAKEQGLRFHEYMLEKQRKTRNRTLKLVLVGLSAFVIGNYSKVNPNSYSHETNKVQQLSPRINSGLQQLDDII